MDRQRKKLFITVGGYLPAKRYGGPVTSIFNLTESLGCDCYIVCSNHDFGSSEVLAGIKDGWNSVGKARVLYLPEAEFTRARFRQIIEEVRPDAAYLQGVWHLKLNWPLRSALISEGVPIVLALRGDLCDGAFAQKVAKKTVALRALRAIGYFKGMKLHSTSDDETASAMKRTGAKPGQIVEIPNLGVQYHAGIRAEKETGSLRCVVVSRIARKKNILAAVAFVAKADPGVALDIYGPIEDEGYFSEIKAFIDENGLTDRVCYQGALDASASRNIFGKYDAFLFPTLSENYGHVIAESLACGCPVVISRGTTPWDDVDSVGGFACRLDDEDEFVDRLNEMAAMDQGQYDQRFAGLPDYYRTKTKTRELVRKYQSMFFD